MAAAAVEIGEIYQSKSRSYLAVIRGGPVFIVVLNSFLLTSAAIDGDELRLILSALIVLGSAADLLLNPTNPAEKHGSGRRGGKVGRGYARPRFRLLAVPTAPKGAEMQADYPQGSRR